MPVLLKLKLFPVKHCVAEGIVNGDVTATTVTLVVTTLVHAPAVTVCETTYDPGFAKVMVGFVDVGVATVTPAAGATAQLCATPAVPV